MKYLLDSKVAILVRRPDSFDSSAKAFGSKNTGGGDLVLPISAEKHETAVAVIAEVLREDFTATEILIANVDQLFLLAVNVLNNRGFDITVIGKHDVAVDVETHDRGFGPQLNDETAFVHADAELWVKEEE